MNIQLTGHGIRDTGRLRLVSLIFSPTASDAPRFRRGFTLLESALATIIIGVGVLAVMGLFEACARQNQAGTQATTAMLLAGHIQELMEGLPFSDPVRGAGAFGAEPGETLATYNDIDDFDNQTFNPPIDSTRMPVPALSQYSQVITLMPVFPNQPSSNSNEAKPELPKTAYTGAVRIRVKILYRLRPADAPQEVYRAQWIRLDK
jgi:prepilin-type N-terminal cleavage/methylation domain-containing protein